MFSIKYPAKYIFSGMYNFKYNIVYLIYAVLISIILRITSDALHVPGFYDLTGVIYGYLRLRPIYAFTASILIPLALSLYYNIYIYLFWIYVLCGVLFYLFRMPGIRVHYLGVLLIPILYAFSWLSSYMYLSNTVDYLPVLLRSRGFLTLLLDGYISIAIALMAGGVATHSEVRGRSVAAFIIGSLVIISLSYYTVYVNEWGIASLFPAIDGYRKFHTKMDFVWLPLGVKGINNYYYPIERFDRDSPRYQVWIGLYWIQGRHDIYDVGLVSQFAIWDQNFWLGIHGARDPYTYVDVVYNVTMIKFKGRDAVLMYGGMVTLSDVEPYEEIRLRGFFITYYDTGLDRTVIIYAAATEDYFNLLEGEFWSIIEEWGI